MCSVEGSSLVGSTWLQPSCLLGEPGQGVACTIWVSSESMFVFCWREHLYQPSCPGHGISLGPVGSQVSLDLSTLALHCSLSTTLFLGYVVDPSTGPGYCLRRRPYLILKKLYFYIVRMDVCPCGPPIRVGRVRERGNVDDIIASNLPFCSFHIWGKGEEKGREPLPAA